MPRLASSGLGTQPRTSLFSVAQSFLGKSPVITGAWHIAIYTETQFGAQQLPVPGRSLCLHFRRYEFGILEVLKVRELLALFGPYRIESRLDQMVGGQTFELCA